MKAELFSVAIPLCLAASAFFAGTETGMVSINHARLMHLVRSGSKAAKVLSDYSADMQRFLGTILVGNNLMNVMLSTASAGLAQICFPDYHTAQTLWAVGMAFIVLFFSEYLPKLFFTTRPLRRTLLVARPFRIIERLLMPITELILFMTRWLVPKTQGGASQQFLVTREYIQNVVSDSRDGSRITAVERLMINRVLALKSLKAKQVMTPLSRVSKVTVTAKLDACYRLVRDSGHVRLPVFSEDGGTCVGVLNVLDALASGRQPESTCVRDCMEPTFFVSAGMHADDVLPVMRKRRQPMVMVRDASGAILGIITEANVLSALTGNLQPSLPGR